MKTKKLTDNLSNNHNLLRNIKISIGQFQNIDMTKTETFWLTVALLLEVSV